MQWESPTMHEKFHALEDEKQQRIINAALAEFGQKGYRHASTDRIVEQAGISKGALFHYFGSKEKLYLFLLDWTAQTMANAISTQLDMADPDLFSRLLKGSRIKMAILRDHPSIWRFWDSFESERPEVASGWMQERIHDSEPLVGDLLLRGIDTARFKDGIDPAKAIDVIMWTFAGWSDARWAQARRRNEQLDLEQVFSEAEEYVEFLRGVFYRPELEGG